MIWDSEVWEKCEFREVGESPRMPSENLLLIKYDLI